MKPSVLLGVTIAFALAGCSTASALRASTVATGRTATDIVYAMVLDNLATIKADSNALPWHIKVTQGSIGVTDNANPPNFGITWPHISRTTTASVSRSWAVSWTVVPVIDKVTLEDLRGRYRMEAADNFDTYYGTGSPPSDAPVTGSGIWVKPGQLGHFTTLVTDVLAKAPVSATERGIQLPGVPPPPATR